MPSVAQYSFRPSATPTPRATPTPGISPTPSGVGGQLRNISTRALVQTADQVLIGGFIISGTDAKDVIIRTLGPSLVDRGIRPWSCVIITAFFSNDNWRDTQQTEIQSTNLAPTDDRESAIFILLTVGNYTAIMRGKDATTGIALVEVYKIP